MKQGDGNKNIKASSKLARFSSEFSANDQTFHH